MGHSNTAIIILFFITLLRINTCTNILKHLFLHTIQRADIIYFAYFQYVIIIITIQYVYFFTHFLHTFLPSIAIEGYITDSTNTY